MKNKIVLIGSQIIFIFLLSSHLIYSQHKFYVNLNERADDLFHVTLYPEKLTEKNKIYNFAATAPGTYQLMNIGRYVRSFKAFDNNGNEIHAEKISENRWSISEPGKVKKIVYSIAETWDNPVDNYSIFLMAGSSIEDDHVLINNQCVFGYFDGMQNYPLSLKLEYPEEWKIGTALYKNNNGLYTAENYDFLVDSPILLGRLSDANLNVSGTEIEVYSYSKTDMIKAQDLLDAVKDIIFAAEKFLVKLPVNRYTFLFHFEDVGAGAWEHSYSSEYVFAESQLTPAYLGFIASFVSHEFFHIITPLNIHSELISNFNFAEPKMSQHLWLYESVTEWASNAVQLRGGLFSLQDYLNDISEKLNQSEDYRNDLSLTELALNSFEMQDQFYIVYCRGAVTLTLLDILLLEESGGKRGLREVINELSEVYGPKKSFSEENFFSEFADRTFPEVKDFFDKYIKGSEQLPVKEYFNKLGIDYFETAGYDSSQIGFEYKAGFNNGKLYIETIENKNLPVKPGDVFYKYNGKEILPQDIGPMYSEINKMKPGEIVQFVMKRGYDEFKFDYKLQPKKIKNLLKPNANSTEIQRRLREAWLQNL